jgi:hypothetical protein
MLADNYSSPPRKVILRLDKLESRVALQKLFEKRRVALTENDQDATQGYDLEPCGPCFVSPNRIITLYR